MVKRSDIGLGLLAWAFLMGSVFGYLFARL